MKAKVIIEDGETTIILSAENDFEKDIIEKSKNGWDITSADLRYDESGMSWDKNRKDHRIEITIGKKDK